MVTYGVCRLPRCNGDEARGREDEKREGGRKRDARGRERDEESERALTVRYPITAGGINFPVVPYFLRRAKEI